MIKITACSPQFTIVREVKTDRQSLILLRQIRRVKDALTKPKRVRIPNDKYVYKYGRIPKYRYFTIYPPYDPMEVDLKITIERIN